MRDSAPFESWRGWSWGTILALLAFSAGVAWPFRPPYPTDPASGFFEAQVSSDARGIFHVYFDLGRGFNETDSRFVGLRGDKVERVVRVPLPLGEYRGLRVDPVDRSGTLTLTGARIADAAGRTVRRFSPAAFQAAQNIRSLTVEGSTLRVVGVPRANYLSLTVEIDRPFRLAAPPTRPWAGYAVAVLSVAVLAALVLAGAPRLAAALAGTAHRWPRSTLGAVAGAAVLLNCYPVAFGGRSFVSPNNGVLLLYETIPTLPGYDSIAVKDQMGSDVGAMMWWHLPVSAVARAAVFHDHVLPLWNRDDLCGQPLLGQGQSMLGDPLHWATVMLGGGSALAWDLKFLAAKALFAWGIGLTVLGLGGRRAIAAVATVGSLYIGFFDFRLNHPAFFSLCYGPWILVAWAGLADAARGREWRPVALLALADLAEINSGTVKEAYVMALGLNLAGIMIVLFGTGSAASKRRQLLAAAWGSFLCILVTAPFWLIFLDTLGVSLSSYEQPRAQQLPLPRLVGLFDDLFYRQASPGEGMVAPASNGLVLLGLLWGVTAGRRQPGARRAAALAAAAVVPAALVFGLVPARWIIAVPYLRNIAHIDNTFSCLILVLTLPVAGWGWQCSWAAARRGAWAAPALGVGAGIALLVGGYFAIQPPAVFSPFFRGYALTLGAGAVIVLVSHRALAIRPSRAAALWLALGSFAFLWRYGQYLHIGFDRYVFTPQVRADLSAPSPALDFVASHQPAPARTLGLGLNFYPGFNQLHGIESIYCIEALRSRQFVNLADALGLMRVVAFTTRDPNDAGARFRPIYDALNVEYFLGNFQPLPAGLLNWEKVGDLDLAVHRSTSFWPRAYFVPRLRSYAALPQLAGMIEGATGPFAAVEDGASDLSPDVQAHIGARGDERAVPAASYMLTANRTGFTIDAPGPGVAVLLESWFPDDFRATVNGQEVPYFRVNHAFKGVYLGAAGSYHVTFSYWPRHLTLALYLAAAGLALAIATLPIVRWRRTPGGRGAGGT